jgi:hypothetical protein
MFQESAVQRSAYWIAIWVMFVPFGWGLGWAGSRFVTTPSSGIEGTWVEVIFMCYLFGGDIAAHAYGLVVVGVLGAKKKRLLWVLFTALIPPAVFVAVAAVGPQSQGPGGVWISFPTYATLLGAHFLASIQFALGVYMAARQKPRVRPGPAGSPR